MARNGNWKTFVILGVAAAILITSGGLVMASNFGFKINKQLYASFLLAAAPKRDNWVSIPFNSPYTDAKKLCAALGATTAATTLVQINSTTGGTTVNYPCSLSTVVALNPTAGIRIRSTGTTPTSGILVGSSDESKTWPTVLGGFVLAQAPKKDNWLSIPYHTTMVTAENVCATLGIAGGQGSVIRINGDPTTGANTVTHPCGNTTISNFSLVIGEAINVRKTAAGDVVGKLPPHF